MVYPIFVSVVGSKLYGIDTIESDTDIKGFGFAEPDQLIGLRKFEQQQFKNDVQDGPDKIEGVIYDVKYFIHLCMKGNPTVLELAFADEKFHILNTGIGKEVCKFVRENMMVKSIFKPYNAYLRAQIKKMENTKPIGARKELVDKYGVDVKFMSHGYRLAVQGCQILKDKSFNPTLSDADSKICRDIRNGKYTKEEGIELIKSVDVKMYEAYQVSTLTESVDFNKVNTWLTNLYSEWIGFNYDTTDAGNSYDYKFKDVLTATSTSDIMQSIKPIVVNENE